MCPLRAGLQGYSAQQSSGLSQRSEIIIVCVHHSLCLSLNKYWPVVAYELSTLCVALNLTTDPKNRLPSAPPSFSESQSAEKLKASPKKGEKGLRKQAVIS